MRVEDAQLLLAKVLTLIVMRIWFYNLHIIFLATIHTTTHLIQSDMGIPRTSPLLLWCTLLPIIHPSLYHLGYPCPPYPPHQIEMPYPYGTMDQQDFGFLTSIEKKQAETKKICPHDVLCGDYMCMLYNHLYRIFLCLR